jgi:CRP-like cAMP-binding protein
MDAQDLSSFAGLRDLEPHSLAAIAAASRRLRLPAGRWLVRPGRALSGYFFLLDGRVRLLDGRHAAVVSAGSRRALRPIYPGATAVQTITRCEVASVAASLLEPSEGSEDVLGVPEVAADDGSWQQAFLTSPLMRGLAPPIWQQLLRAMTARDVEAGEHVLVAGAAAHACYVLCAGRADIVAPAGAWLATLAPGMLFGEDALITGRVRNASVVMRTAGRTVSLPADMFRGLLLDAVAAPVLRLGARRLLSLNGSRQDAGALDLRQVRGAGRALGFPAGYAVVGGTLAERQLAAFLLAEQGIDARPLAS